MIPKYQNNSRINPIKLWRWNVYNEASIHRPASRADIITPFKAMEFNAISWSVDIWLIIGWFVPLVEGDDAMCQRSRNERFTLSCRTRLACCRTRKSLFFSFSLFLFFSFSLFFLYLPPSLFLCFVLSFSLPFTSSFTSFCIYFIWYICHYFHSVFSFVVFSSGLLRLYRVLFSSLYLYRVWFYFGDIDSWFNFAARVVRVTNLGSIQWLDFISCDYPKMESVFIISVMECCHFCFRIEFGAQNSIWWKWCESN